MLVVVTLLFVILFVPCIAISICKEGYKIKRPSASITLLHELPVRCEDLERLVINKIVLPESYKDQQSLIEEVCACRPSMDQRILILEDEILNDGGNSLPQDIQQQVPNPKDTIRSPNSAIIAPAVSPLSRNINYSPSSTRVALESSPSPSWNTPTLYPSNMINDPTISDNSSADNFLPYFCTGIALLLVCTCIISAWNILDTVPNNPVISPILSGTTTAPWNPGVSNESEEDRLKARRRIVIESLFLSQDSQLEEGNAKDINTSDRHLKYDSISKKYKFSTEKIKDVQCSICLDDANDDLILGKCTHIYHRACIMKWMQDDHNECPNCRQLMWEPETYKYIEECVKQGNEMSAYFS